VQKLIRDNLNQVSTGGYKVFGLTRILGRPGTTPVLVAAALLIIGVPACPQNSSNNARIPAAVLLRKAVSGELKAQADDHSHWMYQVRSRGSGKEQVKEVVETRDGDLDRLQSVNGQPITGEQQKQEDRRIERLTHKQNEQNKRKHAQEEDARQIEHLFKVLPDAVIASYGENKDDLIEILFKPNPNFHPSSREDAVFHAMTGRIWINQREDRLAEIEGHLVEEVKFAGGLLGHLDKGGEFQVKQSEVAPGHWEIALLHINMRGKALFFKTIAVQQDEVRTNFQRVPDNLTLAEAAKELQKRSPEKSVAAESSQSLRAQRKLDKN
jgi:hypothetical protein